MNTTETCTNCIFRDAPKYGQTGSPCLHCRLNPFDNRICYFERRDVDEEKEK